MISYALQRKPSVGHSGFRRAEQSIFFRDLSGLGKHSIVAHADALLPFVHILQYKEEERIEQSVVMGSDSALSFDRLPG